MTNKYKTTFISRWGTFSYESMPFGLSNAGATFQRAMQIAFDNLIGKIFQIYLDDLIVYSKNRSDHFGHLRNILVRCKKFGISLNPSKSISDVTKGKLLGYIVCRFVPDFAVMVKPIHNLLKKDRSFSWADDVENAFVGIKKEISSAPVLANPDFEKEFMIYTNATEEAIYVILMQCDD
jgi:hypothetical protein